MIEEGERGELCADIEKPLCDVWIAVKGSSNLKCKSGRLVRVSRSHNSSKKITMKVPTGSGSRWYWSRGTLWPRRASS